MKLSKIVKQYRNEQDITMEQLCEKSGLSRGFISRIEKGDFDNSNVSLETIIKISRGFNVKVKEIFYYMNIIEQDDPVPLKIYLRKKYNISDENDAETIENIIDRFNK